jgi:hypothetical protein
VPSVETSDVSVLKLRARPPRATRAPERRRETPRSRTRSAQPWGITVIESEQNPAITPREYPGARRIPLAARRPGLEQKFNDGLERRLRG